jgi:hypothetical protein
MNIILILSILLFITLFYSISTIVDLNNKIKNQKNQTTINLASFKDGCSAGWLNIQICLYHMYKNNELLDFASLINSISDKTYFFQKNTDEYKKYHSEYLTMIKTANLIKGVTIDPYNN